MRIPTLSAVTIVAGLLVLAPATQAHAAQSSPSPEIKGAYQSWVTVLEAAKCDGTAVSREYTNDAVLIATFSTYIKGRADLTKYFDTLTCNPNLTVKTDRITTGRDGDMGYATGLYTFSYTGKDGATVKVPARFTFVFVDKDGRWVIANHHSSTQIAKVKGMKPFL
jgi:uncharacterized protein (TIGR02246 family)